jgi:peptide/nickel transport system substrate-binding protein
MPLKGLVVVLLSTLAVFATSSATLAARTDKTVLTVGMFTADVGRLDPHLSTGTPDTVLFNWMFNGLVRFKPGRVDTESLEPDLAERWESSADGKTWTFHLRRGAQFHGGYGELTADDVVYSLKRAADPKRSSFSSDYAAVDKVEAVDPYTVRLALKRPVPSLLGLVSNNNGGYVVCKKAAEEMGENFQKRPIGTGPFVFANYEAKQLVTLVANKQYFRGAPKIEKIVYRFIPSDATRALALTSGELDLAWGVRDEKWIQRMRETKGILVDVTLPAELFALHLNITKPPLDDIRVRQAVAYAINRQEIIQFKGASSSRVAGSIVPQGYLGYSDDVPLLPYDPAKAKALLTEAGYATGVTLKAIQSQSPNMLSVMQVVQAQLRRAGINLELEVVEHATFHSMIRKDLGQVIEYTAARFPVADTYLTQFYHSRSIIGTPTAVTNFSHCNDADQEIDDAAVEPNIEKKKKLWKVAQQKLMNKVCSVPLFESLGVWARRDDLDYGYKYEGSLSGGPVINETTNFK